LVSALNGHPELRMVDRNQVAQALRSESLGPNARVDAATAAKIGQQLGARYAVTGHFADFYGKFRLDARIVDTENGQIVKVVSNDDPKYQDRADLFRLIQMVAHRVLAETTKQGGRGGDTEGENVPTEALSQYSLGLLSESKGDKAGAVEHYQRALSAYPTYRDAREGLQRAR
jgi:TolB-like protein